MSKIKIFIIVLVGLFPPLYVLWNIVLVEFDYSSISAAQSGVKITAQTINGKEMLVLPEEENYYFNNIQLEIDSKELVKKANNVKIEAYQNFLVTFYPKSEKVLSEEELKNLLFLDNSTDLPAGSLFFNGDAISIMLPGNSYRSIFSAELFEKMGYKWEDVVSKEVGFAGDLEKKENFLYGNAHPDGTFIDSNGEIFLVWDKNLLPVEKSLDLKKISPTSPIKIDLAIPKQFAECDGTLSENKLVCSFEKNNTNIKSNYVFISSDFKFDDLNEVKVELSTTPSKWAMKNNFLVSIDNIKLKLIKKYRGYIPFI